MSNSGRCSGTVNAKGENEISLSLRVMLAVLSVVSGFFGSALVALGATQRFDPSVAASLLGANATTNITNLMRRDFAAEARTFNDPFLGIILMGALSITLALLGLVGAVLFSPKSEWRRSCTAAFAAGTLMAASVDLCVATFFFVCGDLAVAYVRIYWPYIARSVAPRSMAATESYLRQHLHAAGFIVLGALAAHLAMGLAATLIAGVCYIVRRLNVILSVGLAAASAALLGVSAYNSAWVLAHHAAWVLVVLAIAACAALFLALLGLLSAVCGGDGDGDQGEGEGRARKAATGAFGGDGAEEEEEDDREALQLRLGSAARVAKRRRTACVLGALQLSGLLAMALVVAVAAVVALGVADSEQRGVAADVAALEDEAAHQSFIASDDAHLATLAVAHFALVGLIALMLSLCLLCNAATAAAALICVPREGDVGGGGGGTNRGAVPTSTTSPRAQMELELTAATSTAAARTQRSRSSSTSEGSDDVFYDGGVGAAQQRGGLSFGYAAQSRRSSSDSQLPAFREWDD